MNDWRLQAKYRTECARCTGWIERGAWIVEHDGEWVHCVCPGDVQQAIPKQPLTYTEYVVGPNGVMEEREMVLEG
jgi:hypothetical protein